MCDEKNLAEFQNANANWRRDALLAGGINRRQFGAMGAMGAAATLAACAGMEAGTGGLKEDNVTFKTMDGTMDAFFVRPSSGKHPAVICWPDIAGLRDAFKMMARRTAAEGYAVLVVNPYYRDLPAPQFADFAAFRSAEGFSKVGPWRGKLDAPAIMRDTQAIIPWLDMQASVDKSRGVAAEGYCMGGPFTVWSAAGMPERMRAAASFHGGGLVSDSGMSPHKLLGQTQSSFLFAIAQNDDAKEPDAKNVLRDTARSAERTAVTKVYAGDHGWTVIDSPAYAKQAAEEAYADKMTLYSRL